MRPTILCFFILAIFGLTYADEPILPLDAIKSHGSITIIDGSSFYTFRKDHSFSSGPLGLGGRTIEGKWRIATKANESFEVEGKWSWINGLSRIDDYRRIVFDIRPGTFKSLDKTKRPEFNPELKEIFQYYFLIDELTQLNKLEKTEQGASANP